MSHSADTVRTWTIEDVHHWLVTEVKVHQSCADRFTEEEVSGEILVDYEKKDILDLGVKHGPAVKITSYLEKLRKGSQQQEVQAPADVEEWTKQQVNEWLRQHVKLDGNRAERLLQEEVSGDCLVHFRKQDFLDLELKKGPAVKILKELGQLKPRPQSTPRPVLQMSTKQKQPHEENLPLDERPEKEETPVEERPTTSQEAVVNPAVVIKNCLDRLGKKELKSFKFQLKNHKRKGFNCIPRSKLEDKDTVDIATLVTDHYGCTEALGVTRDVLSKINQRALVSELESYTGVEQSQTRSAESGEDAEDMKNSVQTKCKRKKKKCCHCFINVKIQLPPCFD